MRPPNSSTPWQKDQPRLQPLSRSCRVYIVRLTAAFNQSPNVPPSPITIAAGRPPHRFAAPIYIYSMGVVAAVPVCPTIGPRRDNFAIAPVVRVAPARHGSRPTALKSIIFSTLRQLPIPFIERTPDFTSDKSADYRANHRSSDPAATLPNGTAEHAARQGANREPGVGPVRPIRTASCHHHRKHKNYRQFSKSHRVPHLLRSQQSAKPALRHSVRHSVRHSLRHFMCETSRGLYGVR